MVSVMSSNKPKVSCFANAQQSDAWDIDLVTVVADIDVKFLDASGIDRNEGGLLTTNAIKSNAPDICEHTDNMDFQLLPSSDPLSRASLRRTLIIDGL